MAFRMLAAAIVLLCALPARAQQSVYLQFHDGRVTLRAENAPLRTILAEWARLSGATIVNGDRVAGPAVTLELTAVPERQALDVVLRNVAGYLLAPRRAGSVGPSAFDRILILPTSVAPRNPPPPAATATGPRPVLSRPGVIARPPNVVVAAPADAGQGADGNGEPDAPLMQPVAPGDPRLVPQPIVRRPGTEPPMGEPDESEEQTQPGTAPMGVAPTPSNPFGVPFGSSATPGVIAPVPRQPQQQQQQPPTNRVQ